MNTFPSMSLQNYYLKIIESHAYEHEIHCQLLACLLACLLLAFAFACKLFSIFYSIGNQRSLKTRRRSPKTVAKRKFHLFVMNPFTENMVSIARNCGETQISVAVRQPSQWPKAVAKRNFHFLAVQRAKRSF